MATVNKPQILSSEMQLDMASQVGRCSSHAEVVVYPAAMIVYVWIVWGGTQEPYKSTLPGTDGLIDVA